MNPAWIGNWENRPNVNYSPPPRMSTNLPSLWYRSVTPASIITLVTVNYDFMTRFKRLFTQTA